MTANISQPSHDLRQEAVMESTLLHHFMQCLRRINFSGQSRAKHFPKIRTKMHESLVESMKSLMFFPSKNVEVLCIDPCKPELGSPCASREDCGTGMPSQA